MFFRTAFVSLLRAGARPGSGALSSRALSGTPPIVPIKYLALRYTYVEGILEKRAPFRADHLRGLQESAARGEIALAGAFNAPADGAVFLFDASKCTKQDVELFAATDPYVENGLVPKWDVCEYMAVAGTLHNPP